jgi:hypothetical protein
MFTGRWGVTGNQRDSRKRERFLDVETGIAHRSGPPSCQFKNAMKGSSRPTVDFLAISGTNILAYCILAVASATGLYVAKESIYSDSAKQHNSQHALRVRELKASEQNAKSTSE